MSVKFNNSTCCLDTVLPEELLSKCKKATTIALAKSKTHYYIRNKNNDIYSSLIGFNWWVWPVPDLYFQKLEPMGVV